MSKPIESYESGKYFENNPTWDEEDSPWKALQVRKLMSRNQLAPRSIVEVGCGAGGVLAALYDSLPESTKFVGYEIAPDACSFWGKHKDKGINFLLGDFLLEKNLHFDVLMLLDVVEHVPNPFDFLTAMSGRADYYVFHIPLDLSALDVLREFPLLNVRKKVGHIHYFTKGLALSLLEECGYEVLDTFYTAAYASAPRTNWKKRLALLPRYLINKVLPDFGVRLLGGDTLMVLAKIRHQ
ncbi:MAG: methyltransferase domain-containing protein [Methylococcaceae bacterium]